MMRTSWLLCALLCLASRLSADGVESFRNGLKAFEANGPSALLDAWYPTGEQSRLADIRGRLAALASDLGPVVKTEVFAPRQLGRHVQRLYGVIYFHRSPLWLRADYYSIDGREGYISLEFSKVPDDILPLEIGVASMSGSP